MGAPRSRSSQIWIICFSVYKQCAMCNVQSPEDLWSSKGEGGRWKAWLCREKRMQLLGQCAPGTPAYSSRHSSVVKVVNYLVSVLQVKFFCGSNFRMYSKLILIDHDWWCNRDLSTCNHFPQNCTNIATNQGCNSKEEVFSTQTKFLWLWWRC